MEDKTADIDILERLEYFEPDDLVECAMYRECIEGVKTLIAENKKLKEENEHLIEINNKYNDMEYITRIAMLYIPKSKVEEEIDKLNKKEKDLQNSISDEEREEYSDANISFDLMDIDIRRETLQSLLGKE